MADSLFDKIYLVEQGCFFIYTKNYLNVKQLEKIEKICYTTYVVNIEMNTVL